MSYRVVLWTTGHVASFAGRAIVEHPNMELVGAYAWSPEKAGRDVGELIGTEPLGIIATSDVDEILALRPDVVGYYPIMRTEAVPEHTDTICRFLEAGINVVSTANVITGRWWGAEARFAEAGRKGDASLFASGVNPGFVNQLMLTATGVCSEVRRLSVWEEAECSGYDSPELWETVAFGHDPSEPDLDKYFHQGTAVFEDEVAMMADALEVELDEIRYVPEVALATKDLDLGWMKIAEGHIAGLKNTWLGIVDGVEVIELGTIWKMTEDVEPNWEIRHGWHVADRRHPDGEDALRRLAAGGQLLRAAHGSRHADDRAADGARHPARGRGPARCRDLQGPAAGHRRALRPHVATCTSAQRRINPPSTMSVWPVMNAESSDARNETRPTRSSGSCVRLITCMFAVIENTASAVEASMVAVRVRPGAMTLTVMLSAPSSVASARVSPITPPLLAR